MLAAWRLREPRRAERHAPEGAAATLGKKALFGDVARERNAIRLAPRGPVGSKVHPAPQDGGSRRAVCPWKEQKVGA